MSQLTPPLVPADDDGKIAADVFRISSLVKFFLAAVASANEPAEDNGEIADDVLKLSDLSGSTLQLPLPHAPTEDNGEIAADMLKIPDLSGRSKPQVPLPRPVSALPQAVMRAHTETSAQTQRWRSARACRR